MPTIKQPERLLHQNESNVIRWMLEHASTVGPLDHLIPAVESLRVVGRCDCGRCPSVDFVPEDEAAGAKPVADAVGSFPDGFNAGLILWGKDKVLTALEVYPLGVEGVFPLPEVDTLKPWKQHEKA